MSNIIKLSGNLGQDPELKYTPSGKAVCVLSVADSYGQGDKKQTQWIRVEAWDHLAEAVATVKKGTFVVVDGFLKIEQFEKNGEKKTAVKVSALSIMIPLRNKPFNKPDEDSFDQIQVDEDLPF